MLRIDRHSQGHRVAVFKSVASLLSLIILFASSLLLPARTHAALSDTPVGWSNFSFVPITNDGQPIHDYEGSSDPTANSTPQPDRVDISSCSPDGSDPGSQPSAMSAYYDIDGNLNTLNDAYIAFRIRLNASPVENSQRGYDSGHWYVLIDIDNDGWKEFAVDVDGSVNSNKADRVYLLYNDFPQQEVNGRSGAQRAANDTLANDEIDIWYAAGPAAAEYLLSHTRVSTATPACFGGNEFWLDIQLPVVAFKDQRGAGGVQKLYPGTPARFFFSTSTSVTDPMAKDWIQGYPTPGFSDSWLPYVTGRVYFPESGMDSEDFVLEVGDDGENIITFKNNTTDNITDVASAIQYITVAAANLNPTRALLSTEASWAIYAPGSLTPRDTGTITASLDTTAIYTPYSTSQTVYLYTWAFGKPSPSLEQYTNSTQFNDALKILRAGETLNLTVTVQCLNLVGDSRMWFFFRATEYNPTSPLITDLSTIGESQRMNLYYSSVYGSQPAYWWPLHNSYDSYDSDINTGHSFKNAAWTRMSTIDAFAKSYKMVHQMPETSPFSIHLESRQDTNASTNLGTITFDGMTYALATDISKTANTYNVHYSPDSGYSFVSWETTGGVSVADPNLLSTMATVTAAGTLRAVYQANAASYNIHLESRRDDNSSTNLGSIVFDSTPYSPLDTDISKTAGTYNVQYNPDGGYSFVSWETIDGVSVADPNSASTTATVSAAGTLRAVYQQIPPATYSVHLESRQDNNITTNLGSIAFDSTTYSLATDISKTAGTYNVQYNPNGGYSFVSWETTGGVSVADPNLLSTTATVTAAGTLRAVYRADVFSHNINLESRQDNNVTTNLGTITFDSTAYTLATSISKTAGSYNVQYNPASGYLFVSWEVAGGVTVIDANSSSTTATISDNGTLRAVYQNIPPPTYAFHICGTKFNDVNEDGQYDVATENGINGVSITLLGPDQATKAEIYYAGQFTLPPPDDKNPTPSGENDLIGAYCFNLANLQPGTYTFYITETMPSGSTATSPTMIGPITLVAGSGGTFESLNNHFGNIEAALPPPLPPPPPPSPPQPRPSPVKTQPSWSAPPSFTVTNLTIQINGQTQTICVEVYNSGGSGSYNISLTINGVIEARTSVALNSGSTQHICWTVHKMEPGNYLVEVAGRKAWFTVTGADAGTMAVALSIIGFFMAVLVGLIVVIYRQRWQ